MSTFIWGKIKLKNKKILNNYRRKNILVYFCDKKNDLFQSDLDNNEIYFNIACGYDYIVNLSTHKTPYLNCNESYFLLNIPPKVNDMYPYFEKLLRRIKDLQEVIVELFNDKDVEKITYFHTDTGNENSITEYKCVNWRLDEFADKFFIETILNRGFTPTIRVEFCKDTINND